MYDEPETPMDQPDEPEQGGFMARIKAMLMGAKKPMASPQTMAEGKPWEDPSLAPPGLQRPTGIPQMPRPTPSPGPQSIADDPMSQAIRLMKQRELMKRFIPESMWNTPQQ